MPHISASSDINTPHVLIATRSPYPVRTTLSIPGIDYTHHATLTRDIPVDIRLPVYGEEYGPGVRVYYPGKRNKTIIIRSSDVVTVYGIDNVECCGDVFLVLPTEHLGTEYYVVTYDPLYNNKLLPALFVVSALGYDATTVNIVTKSGEAHEVVLRAYESYRFDATEDLTSTHIRSDHPISVTSGVSSRVPVGVEDSDGMIVNLVPVDQWGRNFVMAPYLSRACGYVYRILSSNQTTSVRISTVSSTLALNLQAGDFYEGNVVGDKMISVTSDFPVLVVKYMKGKDACVGDQRGDPAMMIVPPVEYTYSNVTFPVFTPEDPYATKRQFINVIINCDHVDGLMFDGTLSMSSWNRLSTVDGSMCAIRGEVSADVHSVGHTNQAANFTVSAYMMTDDGRNHHGYTYQVGYAPNGRYLS